jgi:hypothetical protein
MDMKNVLLTFVGKQDPFSEKTGKEGAIVTIVRKYKPDVVVMLPSADMPGVKDSTQTNAYDTKDWIFEEVSADIDVYVKPLSLLDPTSYRQIMSEGEKELKALMDSLCKEDVKFYLNSSSGTPEMKSMWLVWANSAFIPKAVVLQVADPTFVAEDDRVRELDIDFIEEVNRKNRAARYIEQGLFKVAAEELDSLSRIAYSSARTDKACMLRDICMSWHCWDLISYKEAYDRLAKVYNKYSNSRDIADILAIIKEQVDYLNNLKMETSSENMYNMVDLFYNMKRRFKREDYTDTLARFWRLYEGSMYYALRIYYNIEPEKLYESHNKQNLLMIRNGLNVNERLNYSSAHKALKDIFHDKKLNNILQQTVLIDRQDSQQRKSVQEALEDLRNFRNESIVAHGMKSVSRHYADAAIKVAPIVLKGFFRDDINAILEEYPFEHIKMETIAQFTRMI